MAFDVLEVVWSSGWGCKLEQRSLERPKLLCWRKGENGEWEGEEKRESQGLQGWGEIWERRQTKWGFFSKVWSNFSSVILLKSCISVFKVRAGRDAIILTCLKQTCVWVQPCFQAPLPRGSPPLDSPELLISPHWGPEQSLKAGTGLAGSGAVPHKGEDGNVQQKPSLW